MPFTPREGDVQNEYGFWQDAAGSLAPGQGPTPGELMNPEATNYYDPAKGGMRYNLRNGQRVYQSDGKRSEDPGGGAFHGTPQFNQQTGQFDVGLDWGKILSYAAAGGIGGGALAAGGAFGGGGAGAAGAASGSATLPSSTLAGSSVLGGSGLSSAGVAGGAGVTGATTAGAGAVTAGVLPSTTIGTGSLGPITGGTSGAGMGGGNVGFLDALKTGYDTYKKGKQVYDTYGQVKDALAPSKGSAIAQTAGSIEAQRANAMIQQARLQQSQDQLAQNRSMLALRAPGQEAANSVRGDVLANSQDSQFTGLPSYIHIGQTSGGLRPSMLSDSSRALGANMSRNALANNLSGKDVPDLTPLPEAGKLDTGLQLASGIGSFWDALSSHGGGGGGGSSSVPGAGAVDTSYQGEGTPGFPGDNPASPVNNPMPPITSQAPNPDQGGQGIDPEILKWLQQSAQPGAIQ